MFTFILISNVSSRPSTASLVEGLGDVHAEAGDRYAVHAPAGAENGWLAVEYLGTEVVGYEEEELAGISQLIGEPCFFLVEGRNGDLNYANRLILNISKGMDLLVDNDHGVIDQIGAIKEKIMNGIPWMYSKP